MSIMDLLINNNIIMEKFYLSSDWDCHEYLVPLNKKEEFEKWAELSDDDEAKWESPEYAISVEWDMQWDWFVIVREKDIDELINK